VRSVRSEASTSTRTASSSDAAASTTSQSAADRGLFDKVPDVDGASAAGSEGGAGEHGLLGRIASFIGSTAFYGGTAAALVFGYYTYRYTTDQVEAMVKETASKEENAFPGSEVRGHVVPTLPTRHPAGVCSLRAGPQLQSTCSTRLTIGVKRRACKQ
jgi:hypothetical protein